MSDRAFNIHAASARAPDPRQAIAQASQRTGVDFDYLMAQARLESSLDPDAKARTSSASGLYQFIDSTWLETMDRHGEALGFGQVAAAIETRGGRARVSDPASRSQIMALRFDPNASALMAGALANDNKQALTGVLGREPDSAELYLAHFLGAGGASTFLTQMMNNPDASAAALMPKPAAANRAIFYESSGQARSVGEVMQVIRTKMEGAMTRNDSSYTAIETHFPGVSNIAGKTSAAQSSASPPSYQRFAPERARAPSLSLPSLPANSSSMADTLRSSFAVAGDAMPQRARDQIAGAYARLQAFDL